MATTKRKSATKKTVKVNEVLELMGLAPGADLEEIAEHLANMGRRRNAVTRGTPIVYKDGRIGLQGMGIRIFAEELEQVIEAMAGLAELRDNAESGTLITREELMQARKDRKKAA